jgi:hypothetical protein
LRFGLLICVCLVREGQGLSGAYDPSLAKQFFSHKFTYKRGQGTHPALETGDAVAQYDLPPGSFGLPDLGESADYYGNLVKFLLLR